MIQLELRRLGRTEMRATAIGIGCASLGMPDRTDEAGIRAVRRALELGTNYLDTSPAYGESERRVGLALRGGWREKIYLQTKTGTHPQRRGDYSTEGTRWSVENSLRLLGTDYLDAVLIHDPADIEVPLAPGHALDELLRMKERGLVRHVGLGCRQHRFHKRTIETGLLDLALTYLDYTLLDQSAAETTLPLAKEYEVGVQLASVFGCWAGVLTGKEPENPAGPCDVELVPTARAEHPPPRPALRARRPRRRHRDRRLRHARARRGSLQRCTYAGAAGEVARVQG